MVDGLGFIGADFHVVTSSIFLMSFSECWSSLSLSHSRSISSANRKLLSGRPPMDTDDCGISVSSASSTDRLQSSHSPMDDEV